MTNLICPVCRTTAPEPIYRTTNVPVHSVRTFTDPSSAQQAARGEIALTQCTGCGLVWNTAFDSTLVGYDAAYESTQSASPTFNRFHETLARDLVARFALVGKQVAEIGCGQGEFLHLLHREGVARTIGFDPAFRGEQPHSKSTITAVELGPGVDLEDTDFVCCKMTLEHVASPRRFLESLRGAMAGRTVPVFVMVPNAEKVLGDGAFWDVYYEHVLYFTPDSLIRAAISAGFAIEWVDRFYGDQYLALAMQPETDTPPVPPVIQSPPEIRLDGFTSRAAAGIRQWQEATLKAAAHGPVVLWGGGSKAVAFLTTLNLGKSVAAVVDINPARQGTFLPPAGHPIIAPAALATIDPALVIVMNPIYRDEIAEALSKMGFSPDIRELGGEEASSGSA